MAKAGQFIRAVVPFKEDDGRSKVRPLLVLAEAKLEGNKVYLCAPQSTQTGKCHGDAEVVVTYEDAMAVGLQNSAVIRFSRQSLVAIMDRDVSNTYGTVSQMSKNAQRAMRNAARSVGYSL